MACSMSRWAYQTSSSGCLAKAHRRTVPLGRRQHDLAAGSNGEPVVPSRHGQAGGQPLDVPLERAGQGLVEVVDVEDQLPLRRGERPEIGQVRISAQLHPKPGCGRGGQIRRHGQRRPPVEGERGYQHPPVPDRHQLGHPALRLVQQQPDRIRDLPGANSACESSGASALASLPRAARSARLSCSTAPARARPRPEPRALCLFPRHHQPSQSWPLPPGTAARHRRSAAATERSSVLVPDKHLHAGMGIPPEGVNMGGQIGPGVPVRVPGEALGPVHESRDVPDGTLTGP